MSESPLFSVLIANYNNGKYLMEAIESVRMQTYTNWEIILVDDGSTDNSRTIYQELEQDPKIHIFYNEKNMGCGYTKRRCAELANGEICGFLDPDDTLLTSTLQLMVKVHYTHPEVSIVFSRSYYCDKNGRIIGESNLLNLSDGETYFNNKMGLYQVLTFASYKTSAYKKTDGIDANLYAGVDQDLYFKIEEQGKPYVLNSFTYNYIKRHQHTITSNIAKTTYYNLEILRNTGLRRNIDTTELMIQRINEVLTNAIKDQMYIYERQLRNSIHYKIGKFVLLPYSCLKKIWKRFL